MLRIWHNPRCSKSRQTLTLLEEQSQNRNISEERNLRYVPGGIARVDTSDNRGMTVGNQQLRLRLTLENRRLSTSTHSREVGLISIDRNVHRNGTSSISTLT